jgi:hypothetical protein
VVSAGLLRLMAASPGLVAKNSCSRHFTWWVQCEQMLESKAYLLWMSIAPPSGFKFMLPILHEFDDDIRTRDQ